MPVTHCNDGAKTSILPPPFDQYTDLVLGWHQKILGHLHGASESDDWTTFTRPVQLFRSAVRHFTVWLNLRLRLRIHQEEAWRSKACKIDVVIGICLIGVTVMMLHIQNIWITNCKTMCKTSKSASDNLLLRIWESWGCNRVTIVEYHKGNIGKQSISLTPD